MSQGLQVQYVLYEVQVGIGRAAALVEKITALLSFTDPAMSIVCFSALLLASLAVGLVLFLVPMQFIVFSMGASAVVVGHLGYDEMESFETIQGRMNQELLKEKFGLYPKVQHILHKQTSNPKDAPTVVAEEQQISVWARRMRDASLHYWLRVPTEVENAHRFIASRILPVQRKAKQR